MRWAEDGCFGPKSNTMQPTCFWGWKMMNNIQQMIIFFPSFSSSTLLSKYHDPEFESTGSPQFTDEFWLQACSYVKFVCKSKQVLFIYNVHCIADSVYLSFTVRWFFFTNTKSPSTADESWRQTIRRYPRRASHISVELTNSTKQHHPSEHTRSPWSH